MTSRVVLVGRASQRLRAAHRSVDTATDRPEVEGDRGAPRWLREALHELGLGADPATAWLATRVATTAAVVAVAMSGGALAAALLAVGLAGAPRLARPVLVRRRAHRRDAQLAALLDQIEASLRSGTALAAAIAEAAVTLPEPLGPELRQVTARVANGVALTDALAAWGGRAGTGSDVALVATALGLAGSSGGEVARAVGRVAATLRERRELRGEVRALATQARASAAVLGLAPMGFAVLVAGVEPETAWFLLGSPLGWACLVGGLALEALGIAWMARILRSVA